MLHVATRSTTLRNLNSFLQICEEIAAKKNVIIDIYIKSYTNFFFWVEIDLLLIIEGSEVDITEFENLI